MKKIIILLATLSLSLASVAQEDAKKIYIMKNGVITYEIAVSDIDSITFCKPEKYTYYEKMKFIREGGGDIEFDLFETTDSNILKAVVNKYDFRDTTLVIYVPKNEQNQEYFDYFCEAMLNDIDLTGDYQESELPTGSWANFYFVLRNENYKVTNSELREKLFYFENYVRTKLE